MTPYRGECSHTREYKRRNQQLRGPVEVFNEGTTTSTHHYEYDSTLFRHVKNSISCTEKDIKPSSLTITRYSSCILCIHNFIRRETIRDKLFEEFNVKNCEIVVDSETKSIHQPPKVECDKLV